MVRQGARKPNVVGERFFHFAVAITLIYVENLKTTYSGVVFVVTENLSLYQPEGATGWKERLAWRGDAGRSGTVIIVQRQSLFYRGRKG